MKQGGPAGRAFARVLSFGPGADLVQKDLKGTGKAVTIGADEFVRWRDVRAGEMSGREPTFYLVFFRVGWAWICWPGEKTRGPSLCSG